MKDTELIVSLISAVATTAAAIAAWLAARQAKKNTTLTQLFNDKNDTQKRNEVKPLLEIVEYGSKKDDFEISFKNLGFQTVLFLDATITSETLTNTGLFEDIQKCEIDLTKDGLLSITLNKIANVGTLQVESKLSLKYKTIYNDIITDVYHIKRNVEGIPKRTGIDFGIVEKN